MEDNETKKSEVEVDGLGLIDVASEDDSLLFSSFPDPTSYDFSGKLQFLVRSRLDGFWVFVNFLESVRLIDTWDKFDCGVD